MLQLNRFQNELSPGLLQAASFADYKEAKIVPNWAVNPGQRVDELWGWRSAIRVCRITQILRHLLRSFLRQTWSKVLCYKQPPSRFHVYLYCGLFCSLEKPFSPPVQDSQILRPSWNDYKKMHPSIEEKYHQNSLPWPAAAILLQDRTYGRKNTPKTYPILVLLAPSSCGYLRDILEPLSCVKWGWKAPLYIQFNGVEETWLLGLLSGHIGEADLDDFIW